MKPLRVGFLLPRYSQTSNSQMPLVMRTLSQWGVIVDVIHPADRVVDLSTVRVEHDLYVLKKTSGLALSLAGALHAQGATIVNPYPVMVALRDKIISSRILQSAGVPTPTTYVVSHPERLAPLLDKGPLVIKPFDGTCGFGVCVVRTIAELSTVPVPGGKEPVLAQRYHPPEGRDRKIYSIGGRLFGVKKIFPALTQEDKHGEPFTPAPELCEIAVRCGRAFGIDLYGVDIIESDGQPYVVDMSSIPGFKGVPDAVMHLAKYFYSAAERAAQGRPQSDCLRSPAGAALGQLG
jgi:ribosomal protein S6--L-glutamate ligase